MSKQDYYEKQEARKERLEAASDRASAKSNAAYKRADMSEGATGIPLGQPILVGHHSEGRHRAAIKRADNAMRTTIEEGKKAGDYAAKAESVGTGGISSDAPDAVALLEAKLAKLEKNQAFMKAVNKAFKKGDDEALKALGMSDALVRELKTPDFAGRTGFASYQLSNNNAKISSTRKRIAQLKREATRETVEVKTNLGFKIVQNTEANRVQFLFDAKPDAETRQVLKSHGFRWAPSEGAWQRMLNNSGIYSAKQVMKLLTPEEE